MKRFVCNVMAALVCGIAFAPELAQADTILVQGTVTDQGTGQPIAGATVYISGGNTPTMTDGAGNYTVVAQQGVPIIGSLTILEQGYFYSAPPYDLSGGTPVTVNAALIYGGTVLQGAVTDANTGLPIGNAHVSLGGVGGTVTGFDGLYSIDASGISETRAGGIQLFGGSVTAAGYFDINFPSANPPTQINPPYPGTLNFTLVPSTGTLVQGTVTDQGTGQPIAGATVAISGSTPTLTDGAGNYAIPAQQGIPIIGSVFVQKQGYFYSSPSYDLSGGTPVTVNAALIYGGTVLQGAVTDANTGLPIGNAHVSLGGVGGTVTGFDGLYSIDASGISETRAGGIQLFGGSVTAAGYFDINFPSANPPTQINPPYPGTLNFTLVPSTGTLVQGTVTDQGTGQPIAGATVAISGSTPTLTDGAGNYAIPAQQGIPIIGSVFVQKQGYFYSSPSYDLSGGTPVTVNAALIYGGTVLQGAVTDANTGLPIGNAHVSLGGVGGTVTGFDGLYAIDASGISETRAGGIQLFGGSVTAAGYFDINFPPTNPPTQFSPPYPGTLNFQMVSNGVTATVNIVTNPSGLQVIVDGTAYTTPQTFTWQPSNPHTLSTGSPQAGTPGIRYSFQSWSNGGAQSQTIIAPANATTFTATFDPQFLLTTIASPPHGGSVTGGGWFANGAQVLVTATPNSNFIFTGFTGALSGTSNPQQLVIDGPKSVTANFAANVSTATTLASTPNPSGIGQSVSITATVTSSSGTPTGIVTYYDGASAIGSGQLNGSGVAAMSTSALAAGSHSLTARYAGAAGYDPSTSTVVAQIVTPAPQFTNANAATFVVKSPGSFTVTAVGSPAPTLTRTGALPGGVTFNAATGVLAGTPTSGTVGTYTITFTAQNGVAPNATQTFTLAVIKADQAITFDPLPDVNFGSPNFTLAATASSALAVTFASMTPAVCTVTGKTVKLVAAGTCTVAANQAGNANYNAAPQVVRSFAVLMTATTVTTIGASKEPSVVGQAYTVTVTVTSPIGVPKGSVTVDDGHGGTCTDLTLSGAGVASCSMTSTSAGTLTLTAVYSGSLGFGGSSGTTTHIVSQAATKTVVTSSADPALPGTLVTLNAKVSAVAPGKGTPTGSVQFTSNGTPLGTGTLDGSGNATVSTAALPIGVYAIVASYLGDANYAASVSTTFNQNIVAFPVLQFSVASVTVDETVGSVTLTVTHSGSTLGLATVAYASADGTASAPSDYGAVSGVLSWAAGDGTSRTIVVPIISDSVSEPAEKFTVTLSAPTGATLGARSTITVNIRAN